MAYRLVVGYSNSFAIGGDKMVKEALKHSCMVEKSLDFHSFSKVLPNYPTDLWVATAP